MQSSKYLGTTPSATIIRSISSINITILDKLKLLIIFYSVGEKVLQIMYKI